MCRATSPTGRPRRRSRICLTRAPRCGRDPPSAASATRSRPATRDPFTRTTSPGLVHARTSAAASDGSWYDATLSGQLPLADRRAGDRSRLLPHRDQPFDADPDHEPPQLLVLLERDRPELGHVPEHRDKTPALARHPTRGLQRGRHRLGVRVVRVVHDHDPRRSGGTSPSASARSPAPLSAGARFRDRHRRPSARPPPPRGRSTPCGRRGPRARPARARRADHEGERRSRIGTELDLLGPDVGARVQTEGDQRRVGLVGERRARRDRPRSRSPCRPRRATRPARGSRGRSRPTTRRSRGARRPDVRHDDGVGPRDLAEQPNVPRASRAHLRDHDLDRGRRRAASSGARPRC